MFCRHTVPEPRESTSQHDAPDTLPMRAGEPGTGEGRAPLPPPPPPPQLPSPADLYDVMVSTGVPTLNASDHPPGAAVPSTEQMRLEMMIALGATPVTAAGSAGEARHAASLSQNSSPLEPTVLDAWR